MVCHEIQEYLFQLCHPPPAQHGEKSWQGQRCAALRQTMATLPSCAAEGAPHLAHFEPALLGLLYLSIQRCLLANSCDMKQLHCSFLVVGKEVVPAGSLRFLCAPDNLESSTASLHTQALWVIIQLHFFHIKSS